MKCRPWKINSYKKIGVWGLGVGFFCTVSSNMKHARHLALIVAQMSPTGILHASPETHRMFGTVLGGLNVINNG